MIKSLTLCVIKILACFPTIWWLTSKQRNYINLKPNTLVEQIPSSLILEIPSPGQRQLRHMLQIHMMAIINKHDIKIKMSYIFKRNMVMM